MPDDKLPAKQAHGPTHRFVFDPRGRTDPRSIGLIPGTYDLHGMVLAPPLIVAADHPNARHVLKEGDEFDVAENDWALLHLVENIHKDLFRFVRCSAPVIEPEPPPAQKPQQQHSDGYQAKRVRLSLRGLHPNGVPGKDVIPTAALRKQVIKDLEPETRRLGLRDASWQTIDRVRDDV
jgi:hypothetical protein